MTPELRALADALAAAILAVELKGGHDIFPPTRDDIARDVCRIILRTVDVDDMGGCPFCCS